MKRRVRMKTVKKFQLPIKIQREDEYFLAICPVWPDCYAQGSSIDEATSEIISVASALIELYEEEGFKIPLVKLEEKPSSQIDKLSFEIPVFADT